jgi:hypothetical protein
MSGLLQQISRSFALMSGSLQPMSGSLKTGMRFRSMGGLTGSHGTAETGVNRTAPSPQSRNGNIPRNRKYPKANQNLVQKIDLFCKNKNIYYTIR